MHAAVLALHNELDRDSLTSADRLAAALHADGNTVLVLDLARVRRCDPSGVGAVARLADTLAGHGVALQLANPPPMVRMACYLDDRAAHIPVYDSVRAAAVDDRDGLLDPPAVGGL